MKILTVVGARPQFIKAAVISRAIGKRKSIQEILVHTGQHYDSNMSAIFFEEMQIPKPAYQLQIRESLHGAMTGKMLEEIEKIMLQEKPDIIVVYGDTNSTLAGALAGAKLHIPVAHVEAGLRSYNMEMPEEINRILTDRLSRELFCPSAGAVRNLEKEGFGQPQASIHLTGDVMLDAVQYYFNRSGPGIIQAMGLQPGNYLLATIHRAENTNDRQRLEAIVTALNQLHTRLPVLVPLHPRTLDYLDQYGIRPSFRIIQPRGYMDMLQLTAQSQLVLTDSGGLQKEAFFFKKFCVTFRDQTEWTELVELGFNRITGADTVQILAAADYFLTQRFPATEALYGDGHAGDKIAELLENRYLH